MELNYWLPLTKLNELIQALKKQGYTVIGPTVKEGAICFKPLDSAEDLPWGKLDTQSPGQYRLTDANPQRAFSWVTGPQGLKPWLFKAKEKLWHSQKDKQGKINFESAPAQSKPIAFIGAKACDIKAMLIQDKVFMNAPHPDPHYTARRKQLFLIALNCTRITDQCFCVSAGGYPKAKDNFDLGMTEMEGGFCVEVGSEKGKALIDDLHLKNAPTDTIKKADEDIEKAAHSQTKTLPFNNQKPLRDTLFNNLNHPRWEEVADRCLSCGNCTSVCPTCFCHTEVEVPSLEGDKSEHQREWDSCFTKGHSYIVGKVVRDDTKKRYRQWMTHKLGSWHDQFGESGCVGCGRCITWCPVGIDITEEAHAISDSEKKSDE